MTLNRFAQFFQSKPHRTFHLFQIEPTMQCGLRCIMCPWTEMRATAGSMSWETFEQIARYLPLTREVDFTGGGEPLVHPRLLEMIGAAKGSGCRVGFSTNGMQLTPQVATDLLALKLDWVSFSVDAAHADLYERIRPGARFQRVIDQIAFLSELRQFQRKQRPTLMMVLVMMQGEQGNLDQLSEYVELAHRLGVDQVIFKNLDVIMKESDDQRRVFTHADQPTTALESELADAQRKAIGLGIRLRLYSLQPVEQAVCEHNPTRSLFFNWEGNLSPCITLSYAEERIFAGEMRPTSCHRYGNIRTGSIEEIYNRAEYVEFRRCFQARIQAERHADLQAFLQGPDQAPAQLPPAPEACRTCYYLYGV